MHSQVLIGSLFSVVALSAVIACSSTTTTTSSTPTDDGGTEGGTDSGKKDSSAPVDDDSGTPASGDDACKAEPTFQECGACCTATRQKGAKVVNDAVIACGCKGTGSDAGVGACATECAATFCKAPPATPDAACNTCLQKAVGQGGDCSEYASAQCEAEPECVEAQACLQKQCAGKK